MRPHLQSEEEFRLDNHVFSALLFGAIYVEGIGPGGEILPVPVLGNCEISYDEAAIMLALGYVGQVFTYELKIISMFEDDCI